MASDVACRIRSACSCTSNGRGVVVRSAASLAIARNYGISAESASRPKLQQLGGLLVVEVGGLLVELRGAIDLGHFRRCSLRVSARTNLAVVFATATVRGPRFAMNVHSFTTATE